MKTISERIEAAAEDAETILCAAIESQIDRNGNERNDMIPGKAEFAAILRDHFAEPWLDAPDGPGWWWVKSDEQIETIDIDKPGMTVFADGNGWRWQRVIGPSE